MKYARSTLALAAGFALVSAGAAPAAHADDSITKTFSFQAGDLLEIDIDRGHIDLRNGPSGEITVTVETDSGMVADYLDVRFDDSASGLRIEGRKTGKGSAKRSWMSKLFDGDSPDIQFIIYAPDRLDLDAKTRGGHISLADIEGEVSIRTSGGHLSFQEVTGRLNGVTSGGHINGGSVSDESSLTTSGGHINIDGAGQSLEVSTSGGHINIGPVDGDLSAHTSGGHISTGRVEGSLKLNTSGGHVSADGCGGDADVSTSGGDIKLRDMGGFVRASTNGGDLRVELADGNGAGADLSTDRGWIRLTVPAGVGFEVDARADGADVDVDVPSLKIAGSTDRGRLEGKIGSGGNTLRLRSDGGAITIIEN